MNPDTYTVLAEAAAGLVAGGAVGALFFGGLYLTTRRLASARRPAGLVVASAVIRTAATVATAVAVAVWLGAVALLALAVGFTVARLVLVAHVRRSDSGSEDDAPAATARERRA